MVPYWANYAPNMVKLCNTIIVSEPLIMPSPPLLDAVPARTLPPQPPSPAQPAAVTVPVINNNQQQRRRRESTSDSNSDESYEPPTTRIRTRSNIAAITTRIPAEDHSKVKQLLQKYAPKLKYQRYPDQNTTRNVYETDLYNYFTTQSANEEEELIYRFYVDIKDHLTLAYQSEAQASFYHYLVGMKLCLLQERLSGDITRFQRALTDIQMDRRYV